RKTYARRFAGRALPKYWRGKLRGVMEVAVVIPAYRPSEALARLIHSLVEGPIESILVINDGSGAGYEELFERVRSLPRVILLRHEANLGKGVGLKTGMTYVFCYLP